MSSRQFQNRRALLQAKLNRGGRHQVAGPAQLCGCGVILADRRIPQRREKLSETPSSCLGSEVIHRLTATGPQLAVTPSALSIRRRCHPPSRSNGGKGGKPNT